MGVDHGGPYIAVAQHLLNRADIIIRLQEMAGETVPKRMCRSPLGDLRPSHSPRNRLLYMAIVQMIASVLLGLRDQSQN